ncbi:orotidine-5'-phosphate decarboxylase [Celerinatantimonas diazotrophica]|uniref:Orotidine 5'-phosphate decarboxylase n=1 Tax=Celerinatantimonas diazotrophica TaxID=412034 RepID=A0A4R1K376_9GAMM|nr:orotidine-5'-phosphate decarboxylase [Celerinatantimonas diazotrophica]CAG9297153.1 Orotidine 5'-phosphate decarboxylase [Celerinatantimonas diazotrophica]
MIKDPKVIIALDFDKKEQCLDFVHQLDPKACRLKIGKEMFTRFGPELVEYLQSLGFDIFLDLKFHDIPNTVAKAVQSAADLGVWMVNVHASGGRRMMTAAKEALKAYEKPPKLIAVTVLTSMESQDLQEVGYTSDVAEQVKRLATLSVDCGLDGVVCSAQESHLLRQYCPDEFLLVTPGIRLNDSASDDQRRIMTPEKALAEGSSYLVVGRPITQSENPVQVLNAINTSLN